MLRGGVSRESIGGRRSPGKLERSEAMLSKKMEEALNDQMKWEFYSSFLYLAMAGYFKSKNLDGFANWMTVQMQEENAHAMMFFNYIDDAGGRPDVRAFDQMDNEYKSVADVFTKTVEHEKLVTRRINDLMDLAVKEKDHATIQFLAWFVKEQVEEVAEPTKILNQLKMVKEQGNALMMLDRELAQRVFNPPVVAP